MTYEEMLRDYNGDEVLATKAYMNHLRQQLAEAKKDAGRLKAIEAAARNLVKVKGRFHSEVAMNVLIAVLQGDQAMREGE